jgi:hypothetical protein
MESNEVAKLLTIVSAEDGRLVTGDMVVEWYQALKDVTYKVGLEAVRAAMKNHTIDHVEAQHVAAHAEVIMERRHLEGDSDGVGAPAPLNWQEISDAMWSGDPVEWMKQVSIYHQQCRDAGYEDEFMRRGVSINDYEYARRRLGV